MATTILQKINEEGLKARKVAAFKIGDSIRVHVKIKEGDKERVQVYAGIVISRDGHGATETFTVRRISYGEGVERKFPVLCPNIERIEVERSGKPRRAKLYFLRGRSGKNARIRDELVRTTAEAVTNAPAGA